MGISWAYVTPDERDFDAGVAVVGAALCEGVTLLDTADVYGAGHNESVVGRALTGWAAAGGARPLVATKGGLVGDFVGGRHVLSRNARPEHLRKACDDSLTRLGVDVIDLYYLHRVDPAVPLPESWAALAELVTLGKVRALGLSDVTVHQAQTAHDIHPVAAVQSELSLWTRDPLGVDSHGPGDVVGWTRDNGAVFVPFSPLGRGFLTGTMNPATLKAGDFRADHPRFVGQAPARNQAIVDVVRRVAARHHTTAAAVALAWVLARGEHVIPIPGTTKVAHLQANLAATRLQLSREDLTALDGLPAAVGDKSGASAP
jgi:aryl-alcohol dehydrogenase-like predicted oxidoreductase